MALLCIVGTILLMVVFDEELLSDVLRSNNGMQGREERDRV